MKRQNLFIYMLTTLILSAAIISFTMGVSMVRAENMVADGTATNGAVSGNAVSGQVVSGQVVSGQSVTGGALAPQNENPRIVTTMSGQIEGKKTSKAYIWLGVPYGQTERWKAPTAPDSWSRTRSCKRPRKGKGDDCLFVNIYKPVSKEEKMPVMVFLHGGGNVGGTANRSFSSFVKETGVIVVSVEFRQGAFGWLQSRGLQTGDRMTDSGNFAMLDIKLALEWVQNNIEAFGGDKQNVTLSGFSAGARDALNCVISPAMKGLFHKVISFSGGMTTCSVREGRRWSNQKLAKILVRRGRFSNQKRALKYVKRIGKKKLNKLLYSLSDKEVKKMAGATSLRLTNFPQNFRDGKVIPKAGFDVLEYGGYNRVPMILGSNNSEFANVSYKTLHRILVKNPKTFKNRAQFYRLLKKSKEYGSKLQTSFYLERLANKLSIDPYHEDFYTYRFKWGEDRRVVGSNYARYVGAIHGMDVDFLLGRYKKGEAGTSDSIYTRANLPGRQALTSVMRQYVSNFCHTGNPNGIDGQGNVPVQWEKWRRVPGSKRIMTFSASRREAKVNMTSRTINRAKVKRQMKRKLSKRAYKLFRRRILNDRFFM
ncbi:MAG: carboxylesterase/lipase family protein [Eubacterium sp.]|nr:carboxylesterase/lipase family protein [Eubacterium sp.]